jgi:hypothetical protein
MSIPNIRDEALSKRGIGEALPASALRTAHHLSLPGARGTLKAGFHFFLKVLKRIRIFARCFSALEHLGRSGAARAARGLGVAAIDRPITMLT